MPRTSDPNRCRVHRGSGSGRLHGACSHGRVPRHQTCKRYQALFSTPMNCLSNQNLVILDFFIFLGRNQVQVVLQLPSSGQGSAGPPIFLIKLRRYCAHRRGGRVHLERPEAWISLEIISAPSEETYAFPREARIYNTYR